MSKKEYRGDMKLLCQPEDYKRLNIKQGTTEIREDGMRTHGGKGTYEWWYVDAEFENGMIIVTTHYTKNGFDSDGPAQPRADLNITYPNGKEVKCSVMEEIGRTLQASREYCDVTIKNTSIKYVDGHYEVHYDDGKVKLDMKMVSTLPMYRPETGHVTFGGNEEEYMGWFVAQPSCKITGTLEIDGKTEELVGKGYHDHNWGGSVMLKQFNHWYWGRATVGGYTFITANMISQEIYGNSCTNIFMLGKGEEIIKNDVSKVTVKREDTYQHEYTKKFMDNHITFTQPMDDGITYTIEYIREKDIVADCLLSKTKMPVFMQKLVRAMGVNPTYVRCLGKVVLTIDDNGNKTVLEDEGLWEQMFFGNNKHAKFGR